MRAIYCLLVFLGLTVPAAKGENFKESLALQPVLKKYQNAFQMSAWKITLHVGSLQEIRTVCSDNPGVMACGIWEGSPYDDTIAGDIWVLQKKDYTKKFWRGLGFKKHLSARRDQKDSVVHELIHIIWQYGDEEKSVDMLTKAIHP